MSFYRCPYPCSFLQVLSRQNCPRLNSRQLHVGLGNAPLWNYEKFLQICVNNTKPDGPMIWYDMAPFYVTKTYYLFMSGCISQGIQGGHLKKWFLVFVMLLFDSSEVLRGLPLWCSSLQPACFRSANPSSFHFSLLVSLLEATLFLFIPHSLSTYINVYVSSDAGK